MEFEWDEAKNTENLRKHDVEFETAKLVFDDPFAVTVRADSDEVEEERWVTVGSIGPHAVVHVVTTWRGDVVRMISARRATAIERRNYEEAYKGTKTGHRGSRRKARRRH
ncbi:MAG TPA: BrnT family toxin [Acidobacteriaceae bacterium]